MDHESAVERFHDLHYGSLDGPESSELESHLQECPGCRSISDSYRVFHAVLREDRTITGEHPTSAEIIALVYEPDNTSGADREAIEAHVAECRWCGEELSTARKVEASLLRREEPVRIVEWWQPRTILAIAASLLVLALLYPAFLGLYRLPRVQESVAGFRQETARLEETIAELRGWTGTAGMQFVTSTRRRDADPSEIVLREERPYVVLGIDVGIPPELADSESLNVAMVDPEGKVAVEVNLTVGEARRQILSTGVITLVVASSIPPGPYGMRVTASGREDLEPFLEASLHVKSEKP